MRHQADVRLQGEITWRSNVSNDHWRIRVNPAAPFTFKAGQYATLGISTPQQTVERPYSIVSSPYDSQLEFFIELVPDGKLTALLHRLQAGDMLSLRKKARGASCSTSRAGGRIISSCVLLRASLRMSVMSAR